ncbi:MAG: hypothetical protein GY850_05160 [bacterium]|nr:hypothetical protein [bacterium]
MAKSDFKNVLSNIAEGIKDLSSLEVVTYKGTISIGGGADGVVPDKFDNIIKNAKAQPDFKISACTYVALDGDTQVFYDQEITPAEMEAHHDLVDIARQNRQAVVDLFKDAILDLATGI